MKKLLFIMFLFVIAMLFSNNIFNVSYSYSYNIDNSVLFYKSNYEELGNDMKIYIGYIDDYVIPNSSYLYGDNLIENYDFLINFALDYMK